jgi:hypothetical protein
VAAGSGALFGFYLRQGLIERGYTVGQDVTIDIVGPVEGGEDQLHETAAEAVRLEPDLILSWSSRVTLTLKKATSTIPLVMITSGDPVGVGLVDSLARPGGNVTGVSALSAHVAPKRLELLKAVAPGYRVWRSSGTQGTRTTEENSRDSTSPLKIWAYRSRIWKPVASRITQRPLTLWSGRVPML